MAEEWVRKQVKNGNLVDWEGSVDVMTKAARALDERMRNVAADDQWSVDTSEFKGLAERYVGFSPKWL